jgi:hypothetical protein
MPQRGSPSTAARGMTLQSHAPRRFTLPSSSSLFPLPSSPYLPLSPSSPANHKVGNNK